MYAGDYITFEFTAKEESGAVINLTGMTLKWALGRTKNGPKLLTKTVGAGIVIIDAATGRFNVSLAEADTINFEGDYYHEAKLFDTTKPYTIFAGTISFEKTLIHQE